MLNLNLTQEIIMQASQSGPRSINFLFYFLLHDIIVSHCYLSHNFKILTWVVCKDSRNISSLKWSEFYCSICLNLFRQFVLFQKLCYISYSYTGIYFMTDEGNRLETFMNPHRIVMLNVANCKLVITSAQKNINIFDNFTIYRKGHFVKRCYNLSNVYVYCIGISQCL